MFCPSRGRPDAAYEVWRSFQQTRVTGMVEVVFLVDDDDPTRNDYPSCTVLGPPTGDPTGPLNAAVAASTSDIVGFMGDDSRFATHGWDQAVIAAMSKPSFCWGDDGHDRPWPSTCFISKKITDALGYMVPPTLRRGYFDVVWTILASLTDTEAILPGVLFPHDNSAGDPKSPNFKDAHQVPPDVIAADERAFNFWNQTQARRDAQKIRHAIYV